MEKHNKVILSHILTSVRGLQKLTYWVFDTAFPCGDHSTFRLHARAP